MFSNFTTASLGWLLHQARKEKILPHGGRSPGSILPPHAAVAAFRQRNPHLSAARVLKAFVDNSLADAFPEAFTLASYRLYRENLQLMITGEEVRALQSLVRNQPADAVAAWLRKRSVPVKGAYSVTRETGGSAFSLLMPRILNFRQRAEAPSLRMRQGMCHLLLGDGALRASDLVCPDPRVRICRVPSSPRGFEDLTPRWNRKLCLLMQGGAWPSPFPWKWFPPDEAGADGKSVLGDLPPGRRFLFHLAASSTANFSCMIIEKPRLPQGQEVSFWHLASVLIQRGIALLVMTQDDSGIHHAHLVSVVRDGCFLGSLARREVDESDDFSWLRCRVAEPAKARTLPSHHLKVTPLSGDVWVAVPMGSLRNPHFETFLRERHGILILNDRSVPATLEERLIKKLKDLPRRAEETP